MAHLGPGGDQLPPQVVGVQLGLLLPGSPGPEALLQVLHLPQAVCRHLQGHC